MDWRIKEGISLVENIFPKEKEDIKFFWRQKNEDSFLDKQWVLLRVIREYR